MKGIYQKWKISPMDNASMIWIDVVSLEGEQNRVFFKNPVDDRSVGPFVQELGCEQTNVAT